jgi:hypothetical protein
MSHFFASHIGSFTQISNSIIVSDPSYEYIPEEHEPNSQLMKLNLVVNNVKRGKWFIILLIKEDDRDTNSTLLCMHESMNLNNILSNRVKWTHYGDIGVDSGMAGIYDLKFYRDDNIVSLYPSLKQQSDESLLKFGINNINKINIRNNDEIIDKGEKWYNMNSDVVSSPTDYAGYVPYGAVSASRYGDGIYDVYILYDRLEISATKIVFI